MNDHQSFNEVFLTDARIPCENMVGAEGDGWKVARGTLAHERSFSTQRSAHFAPDATGRVDRRGPPGGGGVPEDLRVVSPTDGPGRPRVPQAAAPWTVRRSALRQQMTALLSFQRASEWTAGRAKAARELGRPPGSEGSIGKLALSEVGASCPPRPHAHRRCARAADRDRTIRSTRSSPRCWCRRPAQSIAGGTDEIQHNILGENILGLPKEPAVDRGQPFREVGRGSSTREPDRLRERCAHGPGRRRLRARRSS